MRKTKAMGRTSNLRLERTGGEAGCFMRAAAVAGCSAAGR